MIANCVEIWRIGDRFLSSRRLKIALRDLQLKRICVFPEKQERSANCLHRPKVHRIVRQVELLRTSGFSKEPESVSDYRNRKGWLVELVLR